TEHEVAHSCRIIALCVEVGADSPKMRQSRLQINFNREETGRLVIDIAKALRDKEMFKLKTDYLPFL
ncbi:MAG: hypothetical protein R3319_00345, partial [Candidatus Bathyarchaeia archaeon]|nr:hypothetical protein [Candidatus Bathyarchaeia archaeon]